MIRHKKYRLLHNPEDIPECQTPPTGPRLGSYWRPVKHEALAGLVNDTARGLDWDVEQCSYYSFDQARGLVGTVQVDIPRAPKTMGAYYLGFLNSNNQRKALTFYGGITREGVAVTQRQWKGARHTTTTEKTLPSLVQEVLLSFRKELPTMAREREALRYRKPSWAVTQQILAVAEEGGIFPWRTLRPLVRWVRQQEEPPTGWELLETFGEVNVRSNSPRVQLETGVRFYDLVRTEVLADV